MSCDGFQMMNSVSSVETHWMIILLAPLTIRSPLPLITPLDPIPRRDLFEPTVIPRTPALSLWTRQQVEIASLIARDNYYVTETFGAVGS